MRVLVMVQVNAIFTNLPLSVPICRGTGIVLTESGSTVLGSICKRYTLAPEPRGSHAYGVHGVSRHSVDDVSPTFPRPASNAIRLYFVTLFSICSLPLSSLAAPNHAGTGVIIDERGSHGLGTTK